MFSKLIPAQTVHSIYDIDLQQFWNKGICGIITDLDNTLVGPRAPLATPELIRWLEHVKLLGFQLVIVSNNNHLRVSAFADPLSLPYVPKARKPLNASFRRALNIMKLSEKETLVIGDQLLTDVLGGNRMGLHTILVDPISLKDEGFPTKINRALAKMATALMKKR